MSKADSSGSNMTTIRIMNYCLRLRPTGSAREARTLTRRNRMPCLGGNEAVEVGRRRSAYIHWAVSYTHLTLPTIYSV